MVVSFGFRWFLEFHIYHRPLKNLESGSLARVMLNYTCTKVTLEFTTFPKKSVLICVILISSLLHESYLLLKSSPRGWKMFTMPETRWETILEFSSSIGRWINNIQEVNFKTNHSFLTVGFEDVPPWVMSQYGFIAISHKLHMWRLVVLMSHCPRFLALQVPFSHTSSHVLPFCWGYSYRRSRVWKFWQACSIFRNVVG